MCKYCENGNEYEITPCANGDLGIRACYMKGDIVLFDDGDVCFIGRVDKECGAWGIVADYIPLDYSEACHNDNFISFWEIMCNAGNSDLILDDVVPYVEVIGNIHDGGIDDGKNAEKD